RACAPDASRATRSRGRACAPAALIRRRAVARARGHARPIRARRNARRGPRTNRLRTRAAAPHRRPGAPEQPSTEASQVLLVRHSASAGRLYLEQLDAAVRETRTPDDQLASVHDAACADVRRERANAVVDLLRRTRPVELAVRRRDLLGVRHALLGLRDEPAVAKRVRDE